MSRLLAPLLLAAALGAGCGAPETPGALIEDHRGDWVLVNYWAEWCKPCIKEVPELNRLDAEDGVTVLGINFDGAAGEALAAQIEALGIDFTQLPTDPATALGIERPRVLPTTVVIDPEGRRADVLVGPQDYESLHGATLGRDG